MTFFLLLLQTVGEGTVSRPATHTPRALKPDHHGTGTLFGSASSRYAARRGEKLARGQHIFPAPRWLRYPGQEPCQVRLTTCDGPAQNQVWPAAALRCGVVARYSRLSCLSVCLLPALWLPALPAVLRLAMRPCLPVPCALIFCFSVQAQPADQQGCSLVSRRAVYIHQVTRLSSVTTAATVSPLDNCCSVLRLISPSLLIHRERHILRAGTATFGPHCVALTVCCPFMFCDFLYSSLRVSAGSQISHCCKSNPPPSW